MFRHIHSLRKKLMLTVSLLLAVPMAIVILIAQTRSQSVIREQSLSLHTNLVKTGAERLDTSCMRLDDIYRSIYLNENFRAYLKTCGQDATAAERRSDTELLKKIFLSSLSSRSDLFSIIFIDDYGQLIYATRNEAGSYADYRSCELPVEYLDCIEAEEDRRGKATLLSTAPHMPLRNLMQSTPSYVYAASRQIVNTESHFEPVGIMFITIDLSDLEQLSALILPDSTSILFVCDEEGRVIYDSSGTMLMQTLPAEVMAFSDGQAQHEIAYQGSPYVMASARSAYSGWYVLMLTPQSVFSADAMAVSSALFAAAVFALIIIALVTAVASGAISRPVERLAEAMDETQLRHLNQRVTVTGSDEIARLGNSFNTLMDKLELAIYSEYETALQQKNAEIRALQAQMNPHFLYNVLQSMAAMADLHQVPELSVMATALGKTLRYNISGKEPLVTLRDEIAHTENYLTIQKIRFGDRLHDQVNVPEYVMDHLVPRVSIQPMVENAIIHGFERSGQTGNISISAWEEKGQLVIEVADDGQGIPVDQLAALQASLEESSGPMENQRIGIQNLNTRLRLLYGAAGTLTIDSEEGAGTVVHITIPVDGG